MNEELLKSYEELKKNRNIINTIDPDFFFKIVDCLLKENEELRKENEELKKDYYNVINKIENKIDILDIAISECIYIDDDDKAYKKAVKKDKLCLLNQKRALQEILEEGDRKFLYSSTKRRSKKIFVGGTKDAIHKRRC